MRGRHLSAESLDRITMDTTKWKLTVPLMISVRVKTSLGHHILMSKFDSHCMCSGLTADSSNPHFTPRLSNTNLDSAIELLSRTGSNEYLFQAASNGPLFQAASDISSARHSPQKSSNHRYKTRHQRYFKGWHVGVTACAAMTGAVLVINTVLTIWASVKYDLSSFIGTIQSGNCDQTKQLGRWLHVAINVLSTLLLGASNYCMQCLSAPNREEINRAHSEKRWLDIGVPSVKNLRRVSWRKIILWWCLGLSSIPLHLMYNSAVFSTISAQQYYIFTVDSDFLSASSFDSEKIKLKDDGGFDTDTDPVSSLRWLQGNISSLTRLKNAACIKAYGNDYVSSYGDLLLVSSTKNVTSSLIPCDFSTPPFGWTEPHAYEWICSDYGNKICELDKAAAKANEWIVESQPIDYCLARKIEEHCKLQFSLIIMIIVILCNIVKMICMIVTVWMERVATFVTLGDAVSSFLDDPDSFTADCCLADKDDFTTRKWQLSNIMTKKYVSKRHWWFRAASLKRWVVCNVLCLIALIAASILLHMGLGSLESKSFSDLRKLGFGAVTSQSLISTPALNYPGSGAILANVFVANSPQVILSFIYLNYNGLFTCMLMASEWSGFAHERKFLRVTSPVGKQRSSYRLQLPYIYGIPILIISGILHWLVSQSIFLAQIDVFDSSGTQLNVSVPTCGYSAIAIITVIAFGSIVMLGGIVNGFRVYDAGMPLAGSCSAAISAACHPKRQDKDMSVLPVKWGAERNVGPIGNCSFSSFEVDMPKAGERYGSDGFS